MSDQGSTYAVLQSVPVMVSPLYKLPKKILVASELQMVPDDVSKLPAYPFAVERDVIAQVEAARKESFEAEEAFMLQKKQYEEDRVNKQKLAARKIAPGFLDTDTRILQPQQTYVYEQNEDIPIEESSSTSPKTLLQPTNGNGTETVVPLEIGTEKHFDYLKFEQGLAPADPWDTPENDMVALRSILGSPKYSPKRTSPPSYPPTNNNMPQPPQQPPRLYQQPKNEGVYWSFQTPNSPSNNTNSSYPQLPILPPQPTRQVPALPPKLFNSSPLPTSSTSSPIIPTPPLPPPSDYHKSLSSPKMPSPPPPLPPQPSQIEHLITELGNMGFTRAQAIDALEKNDNDLIKATNFLLDQA